MMRDAMSRRAVTAILAIAGASAAGVPAARAAESTASGAVPWAHCQSIDPVSGASAIDARCFFDLLVHRYQRLIAYEDIADLLQVTQRIGEEPRRVAIRIGCEITGDDLRVTTAPARLRRMLGLDAGFKTSPALDEMALKYKIWLAPHMALRFEDEPQRNFRSGVSDGFTPTEATEVTIDDKAMVHLELKSGDGRRDDYQATFDLYVNPDSMLIERIEGQERLPGGATFQTTLDITPTRVENADAPASADPVPSASPSPPPPVPPSPARPSPAMPPPAAVDRAPAGR